MSLIPVFYDVNREALFIGSLRDVFPPRTLVASLDNEMLSIGIAYSMAQRLVRTRYTNLCRQDGSTFATPAECLAYLQGQFELAPNRTAPGASAGFRWQQDVPSDTWEIVHPISSRPPNLSIFNSAGDPVITDYRHIGSNLVRVFFASPATGVAYLN